jgi:hypothetical protein
MNKVAFSSGQLSNFQFFGSNEKVRKAKVKRRGCGMTTNLMAHPQFR